MTLDWTAYYCAPMVFAVMLPFWFLHTLGMGAFNRLPMRSSLIFAAWWSPAASITVWLLLYVAPGLIWGVYKW